MLTAQGIQETITLLQATDKEATRALRRSIDQMATEARKAAIADIAGETQIKPAVLNKRIQVVARTSQTRLAAIVKISAKAIPIKDLSPKINRTTGAVTADISTRGGAGPVVLKYAFWPGRKSTRRKTKHKQTWGRSAIFERAIKGGQRVKRTPVRLALGPSAAQLLKPLLETLKERISVRLVERFQVELAKVVGRRRG